MPPVVMLTPEGVALCRRNVTSLRTIQPCAQLPEAAQCSPSDEMHIVTGAFRLIASLRAKWALVTRLFAAVRSWLRWDASLKEGTAMAMRTNSTAIATIDSIKVKPH